MPYKNIQKRIEYKKRWNKEYYASHRKQEIKRVRYRKQQLRAWLNNYKKTLKCSKCGESHVSCLEFHHENKKTKNFRISSAIESGGYSKVRIMKEIKNCIVLCANCHRKYHSS